MSVNQSRGDKNEPPQYRRLGRSGNSAVQRNYSGGGGKGGSGGGSTTAPPSSSSFSSNRSFKKVSNNAQGVQPRVSSLNSNSSPRGGSGVPNGAHLQPPDRGPSGAPVTGATLKSTDVSPQKSAPGLPKAPSGNAADAAGPTTPTKADASRAFPLQFGSISPGLMNGMQIPARTSSAPPNLDEQKQAQARLDALKPTKFPTPAVPKQPLPRKDTGPVDQSNVSEAHSIPKAKKDMQPLAAAPPVTTQTQKLSGPPIPTVSVQMPFHHSPLHVQYGGPNPQIQSQGMANSSLPMPLLPMPLPIGNTPPMQQQVFVAGIQHHQMQPQGMIQQGQGLTFSSQMGPPQMPPPPLIGIGPQFQQPPTGKLGAHRKTVKITHPDTHEELRLDKRPDGFPDGGSSGLGPRSHPHGPPPQSQPVPSFPPGHPMNYHPNSYNTSPLFFQPPGSQAPRFYNQVTVKPDASTLGEKVSDSSFPSGSPDAKTVEDSGSLVSTGPEGAKRAAVSRSGSFKDEHTKPGKKVSEIGKKVVAADVTASGEESVKSSETIGTESNSDSSLKIDGPKPEPELVRLEEQDVITVAANETGPATEICQDDHPLTAMSAANVDVLSAETSSLNLGRARGDYVASLDVSETSKAKGNMGKSKKKRRDILKLADSQGTTSDLYMAYKGPEEKKEPDPVSEPVECSSGLTLKIDLSKKDVPPKFEPDDWEDAADMSAPKLETDRVGLNGNDIMTKKYSRDFLLKFSEQFTDLPEGFEITSDIAEAVISSGVNVSREPYPSPGRAGVGPRLDRRPSNVGHDDRWSKPTGPMGPGRDVRVDIGYTGNATGFRPVHNYGVLRNPRASTPGQYAGGILAGPLQSPGGHLVMQRNNSDADRWQRAAGNQKGLIPSPHTPMQVMHKAERKYEVGKVTDEEQAKQRQLKGILNKLTPQNFEKLFDQVKQVNIDNAGTLSGVIAQIFDKALMEPTFCEMYANFCSCLSAELPDFSEDNEKITFKRLLLNKCQEEFERGEREEQEANRTEEVGEAKQSDEQREEKRVKARRRMLGNIRLIGELYKKKMLTERIMHECIKKLLGQYQNPDEEDIEALCKLMSTIGGMIDHPKAKEHMDVYFDTMSRLSSSAKLSSRVRFMLKDVIDLRKNKWQQRRKVEGPKKIEEVHRDAAQERHAQSSRLARGPSFNSSVRRNVLPSPNSGFRGLPPGPQQAVRGYQDARFEAFENRTLAVPVRSVGDESIMLGPQGGLARGMSARGGPNGYGPREERLAMAPVFDQSNVNRDRERILPSSPPTQVWVPTDKVWSEERLRDKSMDAIKEFYSARDEKEVALCIKELNAPSFYPTMISIWVTDSFERKDVHRDWLARLLVNLTKSHDGMLNPDTLVRGLESVLETLEDSVNDAPRAAEFLGHILARILLENVVPYQEMWRLIYDGGEEQGRLVEVGLAAEVLGVVLETIKSEKGETFLNEIRAGSNLCVENYCPPNSRKPLRLDKFV